MSSIDGPECKHGVNAFDPRGCAECTREMRERKPPPVTKANGHVPVGITFGNGKTKTEGNEP